MRFVIILTLILHLSNFSGILAFPSSNEFSPNELKALDIIMESANPFDWLTDLINQMLGMATADFLKQIDMSIKGVADLLQDSITDLQRIIDLVPNDIKAEINVIINELLSDLLLTLNPIIKQFEKIGPIISEFEETNFNDQWIVDLIRALLGISLEDLLRDINTALKDGEIIVGKSLEKLHEVMRKVSDSTKREIQSVIDKSLLKSSELIQPLIEKLGLILPANSAWRHILEILIYLYEKNKKQPSIIGF